MAAELCHQSSRFRAGWMAGFYDAKFDDGLRYLEGMLRHGVRSELEQEFLEGYREGRRFRLGRARADDSAKSPLGIAA
ncbi:MAG TPA: hypothetical protein VMM78_17655 [Thermomicrobiales bacterium]|nr:hypothetical protein [Thermomicrobiales bacterium]